MKTSKSTSKTASIQAKIENESELAVQLAEASKSKASNGVASKKTTKASKASKASESKTPKAPNASAKVPKESKPKQPLSPFDHKLGCLSGKIDQFLISNKSKFITTDDIIEATGCKPYKAKSHVRHLIKKHGASFEYSKQDDKKFKLVLS